MRRWTWWDFLQGAGALASIIGLFALRGGISPTSRFLLALLLIVGVFGVIVSSILARHDRLVPVTRDAMVDTGKRLIRDAKSVVILFGGDMSWARDYEDSIRSATSRGKTVRVLYPRSNAARVLQNSQILVDARAEPVSTPTDSGVRAILIDPQDHADALLYVANRTLRAGAPPVEAGERGSEESYQYVAKVYGMRRDSLLIGTVAKIYEVLYRAYADGRL